MEGSRALLESLWAAVVDHAFDRDYSVLNGKERAFILNFSLNFCPPEKRGGLCFHPVDAQTRHLVKHISYEAFLQLEGRKLLQNPYRKEILKTPLLLPGVIWSHLSGPGHPNSYPDVEGYALVDTFPKLSAMVQEVIDSQYSAVAMDVEHHNVYSFRGFTCLVQLSTPCHNYVIDPLNMFSQMHILNRITVNANIIKVIHNAEMDVIWLQRDFGVHIVNAFDTGKAAKALRLPGGHSLRNVLHKIYGVSKNVELSSTDWSKRPLTDEMLHYAVTDAGGSATDEYIQATRRIFLQQYNVPSYSLEKHAQVIVRQFPPACRGPGIELLRVLLAWRDIRSRFMDVSRHALLPESRIPYAIMMAIGPKQAVNIRLHDNHTINSILNQELKYCLHVHRTFKGEGFAIRPLRLILQQCLSSSESVQDEET
ncbi:hypothetical protein cyc_02972 [Cyclospora cayetanensis]|uniref:3'-5' exonuclease domain-containing protein n=1 Tax=Cyclospora cayetanensis TaxID=88456 RepID=A0A1D3CWW2_9EIME|nr:hypothetical protein cyc_02972 [Cyclospora cayetanensis]